MKHGKFIWGEDDALPPGMELLPNAWKRLFGEKFDKSQAVAREDGGDCEWLEMPNGKIVCTSYRGNNAIYEPAE